MAGNYYYVRSGGLSTSYYYTSKQTGAFPAVANCHATIQSAFDAATPPGVDDYIVCLATSSQSSTGTITIVPNNGVKVVSADGTNCDQFSAGYKVTTTNEGASIAIQCPVNHQCSFYGIEFDSAEDFAAAAQEGTYTLYSECTFRVSQVNPISYGEELFLGSYYGPTVECIDCVFDPADVTSATVFFIGHGGKYTVRGGSIASNTNKPDFLCEGSNDSSVVIIFDGVDLTNMDTAFNFIDDNSSNDSSHHIILTGCKFPSSWTLGQATASQSIKVNIIDCTNGSGHWYSAQLSGAGTWETVNDTYETSASQVDGSNISFEIVTDTSTDCNDVQPMRILVGRVFADFSSAKTIDIEVCHAAKGSGTGSRFTDGEVWLEAMLPANNTDVQRTYQTGYKGSGDPLASETTNAASSDVWTGEGTATTYETVSLTTPGSQGEGWADVYMCIAVPSITAGQMYVSNEISVT